ncbi:uncharacterized protein LOC112494252 [Cephus cinctus]|uniref:Uncharacterized protein LOC112494252 n=1 Tax=Cephus cinctus TaxID=211228 RepID=A0AAJ7W0J7_CEPCN|nr:uncharacterized protein LOC112494252 [Cephus cinctus]XP_024940099.1 uncharacterized protein LOC112494252 [Cephus cinctus]
MKKLKNKNRDPRTENRNKNEVNADTRLIKQLLPLNDLATIENIEKLLISSEEAKLQFVASVVTWKRVGQNFEIYDLSVVEIIKDSVCNNFSDYTEADFEQTVKEWIRLGKQRKERERKTLAKGSKPSPILKNQKVGFRKFNYLWNDVGFFGTG